MTTSDMDTLAKQLIVAALSCCLERTKTAMGVEALADLETVLASLRAKLNADPSSVTGADLAAAETMLNNLTFTELSSIAELFNEAGQTI